MSNSNNSMELDPVDVEFVVTGLCLDHNDFRVGKRCKRLIHNLLH